MRKMRKMNIIIHKNVGKNLRKCVIFCILCILCRIFAFSALDVHRKAVGCPWLPKLFIIYIYVVELCDVV